MEGEWDPVKGSLICCIKNATIEKPWYRLFATDGRCDDPGNPPHHPRQSRAKVIQRRLVSRASNTCEMDFFPCREKGAGVLRLRPVSEACLKSWTHLHRLQDPGREDGAGAGLVKRSRVLSFTSPRVFD